MCSCRVRDYCRYRSQVWRAFLTMGTIATGLSRDRPRATTEEDVMNFVIQERRDKWHTILGSYISGENSEHAIVFPTSSKEASLEIAEFSLLGRAMLVSASAAACYDSVAVIEAIKGIGSNASNAH
ncbi:hypothetical protein TNCV_4197951 [Trichonephila clavipes]|nr:hypothetical protein TNCV_4197951 [Trichonephila clavipes]